MMRHIPFQDLGKMKLDWLDSRFHFNFSGVSAPMGQRFGPLRVWNDDLIRPKTGFDFHGHRDMEIITYVRRGAITHRDHLGNEGRIEAGDIQVMHAGRGIMHGEWNEEADDTLLFQIWVEPNEAGVAPGWAEARFPEATSQGEWTPLVSGEAHVKALLPIHQTATLYAARLKEAEEIKYKPRIGRHVYIVVSDGEATVNNLNLKERDGAAAENIERISITASKDANILLFDLP